MSFSFASSLAILAMATSVLAAKDSRTYAIVRHSGKPIVEARTDPIISPGQLPSAHVHTVIGGTGFSVQMGDDTALNADGTTAVVNGDKSNYWFPKLYFEADNGTFFDVTPTQFNTYYFFEATDDDIEAFPPGLRMLVGDPFKRTPPYTSSSILDAVDGQNTIQPIQFTCPRNDDGPALYVNNPDGRAVDPENSGAGVGFPDQDCDAEGTGLRYDVHFPSCYNPNVDVSDYEQNTAYPSSANASAAGMQNCPQGWIHTPHLFVEVYWDINHYVNEWTPGSGKVPWRLAQGDPFGFGLHMDFISGWNTATLQAMIDTCNAGFDGADKCPDLPEGVNTNQSVTISDPLPNEAVTGALSALPGCNPVQWGPAEGAPDEAVQYSGTDCSTASNTTSSTDTSSVVVPSYETSSLAEATSSSTTQSDYSVPTTTTASDLDSSSSSTAISPATFSPTDTITFDSSPSSSSDSSNTCIPTNTITTTTTTTIVIPASSTAISTASVSASAISSSTPPTSASTSTPPPPPAPFSPHSGPP